MIFEIVSWVKIKSATSLASSEAQTQRYLRVGVGSALRQLPPLDPTFDH